MKAKKTKAIIMAIAAATGTSVAQTNEAKSAAFADMQAELGIDNVYEVNYTWDPFDGMLA